MSVWLSWSGGKDAAFALAELEQQGRSIDGLVTTFGAETARSSMHGVRRSLIEAQAQALDLPLYTIDVPRGEDRDGYETIMRERLSESPVETLVYADLFLEDIRTYRENLLESVGIRGEWPLWGRDTSALAYTVNKRGIRARLVAVGGTALPPATLGQKLSKSLVTSLPSDVDPCGERGEYHTFVTDSPSFAWPIRVRPARRVTRRLADTPFHFVDLLPIANWRDK